MCFHDDANAAESSTAVAEASDGTVDSLVESPSSRLDTYAKRDATRLFRHNTNRLVYVVSSDGDIRFLDSDGEGLGETNQFVSVEALELHATEFVLPVIPPVNPAKERLEAAQVATGYSLGDPIISDIHGNGTVIGFARINYAGEEAKRTVVVQWEDEHISVVIPGKDEDEDLSTEAVEEVYPTAVEEINETLRQYGIFDAALQNVILVTASAALDKIKLLTADLFPGTVQRAMPQEMAVSLVADLISIQAEDDLAGVVSIVSTGTCVNSLL